MRGLTKRWIGHEEAAARGGTLVERVLAARGLGESSAREAFLNPSLLGLHAPSGIPNLDCVAGRLLEAARGGERVVIYGDYDADGVTASAILVRALKAVAPGADVSAYLPHRLEEGYGLNGDALRELASDGARVVARAWVDPAFRQRLLDDEPDADNPFVKSILRNFGKMFVLSDPPDYEPSEDKTVAAIARARGTSPEAVVLDLMLADEGRGMIYLPFLNYADGSLDPVRTMLESPASLPGLSDGGAHVGMICDGSFPTTLLTHWTRDRTRGEKLPLEFLIKRQCRDTAAWVGLKDRGVLQPGYRADLNVIDYDGLRLHTPHIVRDLPAGGRRLMQHADGYDATVVAGQVIQRHGEATGAKPGRLVRGAQPF